VAIHSDGTTAGTLGRYESGFGAGASRAHRKHTTFESTWFFWSALLLGVLRYADYLDVSDRSSAGAVKYAVFAGLLTMLAMLAIRSKNWRLGLNAPTIFLGFTFFACAPLLVQLARGSAPDSYSSAFCSTLVYSMAAFYEVEGKVVSFGTLRKRLVAWLLLLGLMNIGELLLRAGAPALFPPENTTNQLKSAAVLIAIYLATLAGQRRLTILLYAVLVAFLVLRPTSTVVFCLAVCVPIIFLIRNGRYAAAELICYAILLALAIFPFLIYSSDNVSAFVNDVESFVKTDTLGGQSNTQTRLDILWIAFERWQASSLLWGEMFTGGTTVYLGGWWLAFTDTGRIAIHSDYLIILVEAGLLGYVAFSFALAWIIRSHFRWLRRHPQRKRNPGAQAVMVALAIPVTITLAIICSANPYLQYYGLLLVIWFVLLCSEICKCATRKGRPPQTQRERLGFGRRARRGGLVIGPEIDLVQSQTQLPDYNARQMIAREADLVRNT
jgi:hypothetical protein